MKFITILVVLTIIMSCSNNAGEFNNDHSAFKSSYTLKRAKVKTSAAYDSLKQWAKDESGLILAKYSADTFSDTTLAKKAELQANAGDKDTAIDSYARSLNSDVDPHPDQVINYIGLLFDNDLKQSSMRQQIEQLLSDYRVSLGSKWISTTLNFGYNLLDKNLYDPALKAFENVIDADTSARYLGQAVQEKATILFETTNVEEAISYLRSMEEKYPENKMIFEKVNQLMLIGEKAPMLDQKYWIGKNLSKFKGHVTMIDFWAPWCGPCRRAFPEMKELYSAYHGKGLEIISATNYYKFYRDDREYIEDIGQEDYDKKLVEFKERFELPWSVLMADSRANRDNYSVSFIPTFLLVDKKGIVRHVQVGTRSDKSRLHEIIENLL